MVTSPQKDSARNKEKKYLIASGVTFLFWIIGFIGGMLSAGAVVTVVLWLVGRGELVNAFWHGSPPYGYAAARVLDKIWFILFIGGGVLGFMYAWRYADHLFIKNGYLDAETVSRMQMNLAPTGRMERARKTLGFTLLIPFFSWMAWVLMTSNNNEESVWWRLIVVAPLGIVVYLLFHLWKEYFSKKSK